MIDDGTLEVCPRSTAVSAAVYQLAVAVYDEDPPPGEGPVERAATIAAYEKGLGTLIDIQRAGGVLVGPAVRVVNDTE